MKRFFSQWAVNVAVLLTVMATATGAFAAPVYVGPNDDLEMVAVDPLPVRMPPTIIEAPDVVRDDGRGVVMEETDGTGPVIGSNYVRMYIASTPSTAGSEADYINLRFGEDYKIQLNGVSGAFPVGYTLTWDLNDVSGYLEDIPQDNWDFAALETESGDGILMSRVVVVHSGVTIVDWSVNRWLDKPSDTTLGLGAMMLDRKLSLVFDTDHAAINFAARELGKTDGDKYGTSGAWCSEFASWCLRKEGFMTPTGSIGTDDMKDWFQDRGRKYSRTQIKNKTYAPAPGDYLSLFDGGHSAIFMQWIDSTTTITDATRFYTIEGNTGSTVNRQIRTVGNIDALGAAQ